MRVTLTSRRDHNFRVNNRKENKSYNNKLITLYERNRNCVYSRCDGLSFFQEGAYESESLLRLAAVGTFFYLGTPQARGAGTVE